MKITENFSKSEFECRDGSQMPYDVLQNIKRLAEQLQILRDYTGKSITVNSGYRSVRYNARIGGAKGSFHKLGKAADIVVSGMTANEVYLLIEELNTKGIMKIGGLGSYKTFTHVDIRENRARWVG